MKKILLSIAIFGSFIGSAQNLENKIPNEAKVVVSVSGDRLLELVSIAEFNNSSIAKKLLKKMNRKTDTPIESVDQFGFDINSKAYYFYETSDSISYHNFIVKLTNKSNFENLIPEYDKEKIERIGGVNILKENNSTTIWNDNLLLLTVGDKSYGYFKENEDRFKAESDDTEESYYALKKRIAGEWITTHANQIFNENRAKSILTNQNYLLSRDKDAVTSAWFNNYGELINSMMGRFYSLGLMDGLLKPNQDINSIYGVKSIRSNMYFDGDAARITLDINVSKEYEKSYKRMYNSKMDKRFFKYFNQEDALAYISSSVSTQAFLEEYPTIIGDMYGTIAPQFDEEIKTTIDLLSILLDEEAIGELMTGNMLFVLNDIKEKETEYVSYDYDDDYNKVETTKTKKEVSPDFTLMIGSKTGDFFEKLARIGVKYKVVQLDDLNYYKIDLFGEVPFNLYTVVKGDIVFITSSEEKIKSIINNSIIQNTGKHKKLISKNAALFYVNGKEILKRVPKEEIKGRDIEFFNLAQENLTDAYFKTAKMKGNTIASELRINTPVKDGNALKFLLNMVDSVMH